MINLNAKTRINPDQVLWLEGHINYSKVYLADQSTIFVAVTLKKVMEKLDKDQFLRIHRSQVINLHHLQDFEVTAEGVIINDAFLRISRRRKILVREKLGDIML